MKYPKVIKVKVVSHLKLELLFNNGELRLYDMSNLVLKPPFDRLLNFNLFKQVKVDEHGYGIYWNDDLDLAESELFENSIIIYFHYI
jgi:hypothetical protein